MFEKKEVAIQPTINIVEQDLSSKLRCINNAAIDINKKDAWSRKFIGYDSAETGE